MKLFLISLLCGIITVVYSSKSPQCSTDGLMQCYSYRQDSNVETEEDLEKYCRELECLIDFHNACGSKLSGMSKGEYKHNNIVYDALCSKKYLRKDFLENQECLNSVPESIAATCRTNDIEKDHEKLCKNLSTALECADRVVTRKCGKDASKVFSIIYPGYVFFECE